MRSLSSSAHIAAIGVCCTGGVLVDDPVLPAAAHLTGDLATAVLQPAVALEAAELLSCRATQVQYRVGSEVIVRYRAEVRRADGTIANDTLLAAATYGYELDGTVPVEAEQPDGTPLRASVWRWPYDPRLPALGAAVTPGLVEALLEQSPEAPSAEALLGSPAGENAIEVVVYRPTERAVVRLVGADRPLYLKIVPPGTTETLVARHVALAEAGVPVPRVLAADLAAGWFALAAVEGPTLRDILKGEPHAIGEPLPEPARFIELSDAIARADVTDLSGPRSRLADAHGHAAMLRTVLPDAGARLERISAALDEVTERRELVPIHGDLHEGQLVMENGAIVGVLDVDDAGPGHPLGDLATLLGHIRFRAISTDRVDIAAYFDRARRQFAAACGDPAGLAAETGAVLVGLATGPFRIQADDWKVTTSAVLAASEELFAEMRES